MAATVKNTPGFTVAVTVADVSRAECDSKKSLRENYCTVACVSKTGKTGLLSFTGFRAQSAPPETLVKGQLKEKRNFLKKKKIISSRYQR